jgi:hypothetical protein
MKFTSLLLVASFMLASFSAYGIGAQDPGPLDLLTDGLCDDSVEDSLADTPLCGEIPDSAGGLLEGLAVGDGFIAHWNWAVGQETPVGVFPTANDGLVNFTADIYVDEKLATSGKVSLYGSTGGCSDDFTTDPYCSILLDGSVDAASGVASFKINVDDALMGRPINAMDLFIVLDAGGVDNSHYQFAKNALLSLGYNATADAVEDNDEPYDVPADGSFYRAHTPVFFGPAAAADPCNNNDPSDNAGNACDPCADDDDSNDGTCEDLCNDQNPDNNEGCTPCEDDLADDPSCDETEPSPTEGDGFHAVWNGLDLPMLDSVEGKVRLAGSLYRNGDRIEEGQAMVAVDADCGGFENIDEGSGGEIPFCAGLGLISAAVTGTGDIEEGVFTVEVNVSSLDWTLNGLGFVPVHLFVYEVGFAGSSSFNLVANALGAESPALSVADSISDITFTPVLMVPGGEPQLDTSALETCLADDPSEDAPFCLIDAAICLTPDAVSAQIMEEWGGSCEPPVIDPCTDGDSGNNEGCTPCEGDLENGSGCDPCADGDPNNNQGCTPCEGDLVDAQACNDTKAETSDGDGESGTGAKRVEGSNKYSTEEDFLQVSIAKGNVGWIEFHVGDFTNGAASFAGIGLEIQIFSDAEMQNALPEGLLQTDGNGRFSVNLDGQPSTQFYATFTFEVPSGISGDELRAPVDIIIVGA